MFILIFLEMVYYYSCVSAAGLMINIWYHQMHNRIKNDKDAIVNILLMDVLCQLKENGKKTIFP